MNRSSHLKTILLSLAAFGLIIVAMNVYEYLKVKTDIAPALMSEINNTELEEIQSYFSSVSEQLNIVKEWGENGALQYDNAIDLNRLFFPLFENQTSINGLVLANEAGNEYFLYKDDNGWITRQSQSTNAKERSLHFIRWKTFDQHLELWQETSTYDPRETVWFFSPDEDNEVRWSLIHTFKHSNEPGVTAAISWKNHSPSGFTVFGLDIPIKSIQQFLNLRNEKHPGVIFLVNRSADFYISSDINHSSLEKEQTIKGPEQIMDGVLQMWKSKKRPSNSPIVFFKDKQRWLASFQPLTSEDSLFWLGVATPEKEFLSSINSKLFQIDMLDLIIAACGSVMLYLLLLKTGRPHYVPPSPTAIVRLNDYINKGEGVDIEFKSTIRTNLKTGKNGKEIELAWLKAVVAFLNSTGGALLIGVDDAGKISGLEPDGFENKDKCLLHVKNLINHHIGAEFSSFLETTLVEIDEKEVMMIECRPASSPIFLNIGKNEEFYIRSGPSSTKLSPSQTVNYVMQKAHS
jgi:hypothetical protein